MKNMMDALKEIMDQFSVYYVYENEKRSSIPVITKLSASEAICNFRLITTFSNRVKNETWNDEEFIKGNGTIAVSLRNGNTYIDIIFNTKKFIDIACEIKASGKSAVHAYQEFSSAIKAYKEYYDMRNEMRKSNK